ncbi:transmembrane protein [Cricetulus griseus]|uniref:Transmembrane protein n=1 Tax=Cricetulus griseus TaxID=10029 RepID=A0A061IGA8_CRIGR|nr:transmembrane protein [Cricetulus griseus]
MGKDFRYYFQHPWSRMIVAYLVIFFNFLIFAEDPVSHSQTEANVIVVGNCFSFVTNKYPRGVGWRILKVLLWLLAILIGLIAGKFLFHQRLFEVLSTFLSNMAPLTGYQLRSINTQYFEGWRQRRLYRKAWDVFQ